MTVTFLFISGGSVTADPASPSGMIQFFFSDLHFMTNKL